VEHHELAKQISEQPSLQDACDELVELANRRGGEDNITVVLARVELEGGGA
jgi:protein phosphatase